MPRSTRATSSPPLSLFAWHGWNLHLPARWNPVRLEGTYEKGHALFADLDRPRLGLRWQTPRGKFDPEVWSGRAVRDEVGKLASEKAHPFEMPADLWNASLLFLETEPPGRDVWVGHSLTSNRAIELVHHARGRERILPDTILPNLSDTPHDQPTRWSVFELSCTSPPGFRLSAQRLNAGDLSLTFTGPANRWVTVRQIAVAQLALSRKPLKQWLADQQRTIETRYRPDKDTTDLTIEAQRRTLTGLLRVSSRRRRYFWMRKLSPRVFTCALHDPQRDRLVIVQATDENLLRDLAGAVGTVATGKHS